jgi:hypothetical protein
MKFLCQKPIPTLLDQADGLKSIYSWLRSCILLHYRLTLRRPLHVGLGFRILMPLSDKANVLIRQRFDAISGSVSRNGMSSLSERRDYSHEKLVTAAYRGSPTQTVEKTVGSP